MNTTRRTQLVTGAVIAAAAVLVWFVAVVVVPVFEDRACAGVEFRAPADAQPPPTKRDPPPIGGTGGLTGKLREALRGGGPAVYCSDLADPYVLRVGDDYGAYSTNTEDFHVPVLTSGGFLSARGDRFDALAQLPGWAVPGKVWAPAVLARPGGFVLYYVTTAQNPERQCISRAVSANPVDFVDDSTEPLACPPHGGAIDPSPVVTPDGRAYLLWKNYGATDGIVAQELSADGLELVGPMQVLLEAGQGWEGGLVEAPSMAAADGRYYLFYSANDWATSNYAVGYAVCDSPLGPCSKAPGPWLASTDKAQGPGGQEVFTDERGQFWLVLHAWVRGKVGYPLGARNLFVLQLDFVNGTPVAT
jgi:hypothetical protein